MRFDSKVAIVTGAAGPGIGQATAWELAQEGARVVVSDRNGERAENVAKEMERKGAQVVAIKCDVSIATEVDAMVRLTLERWGKIDILVNNAAYRQPSLVVDMTEALWDRIVDVALKGTFLCSRAVLPHMIRQGHGTIINLSSTEALQGSDRGLSHYAAAKAGIMAFTRNLAREVGECNIRVNCVCPGFIWNEGLSKQDLLDKDDNQMIAKIPVRRSGTPQEVARTILFLCSEDANYITGTTLCVSGGLLVL